MEGENLRITPYISDKLPPDVLGEAGKTGFKSMPVFLRCDDKTGRFGNKKRDPKSDLFDLA